MSDASRGNLGVGGSKHPSQRRGAASKPGFQELRKRLRSLFLAHGLYAFKFKKEEDQQRALSDGPWIVDGQPLALAK